jgi:hypothetical protein
VQLSFTKPNDHDVTFRFNSQLLLTTKQLVHTLVISSFISKPSFFCPGEAAKRALEALQSSAGLGGTRRNHFRLCFTFSLPFGSFVLFV